MIRADLHIHSEYSSDGEFRVADIVGKCAAGGVDLFSLTDHNTVRGLDEACDGALQAGMEFVPGIEIDCSFEGTDLHLLGYGIDWKSPDFRTLEETVAAEVMASFGETVGKLRRLGFAVDEQAVLAAAAGKLPDDGADRRSDALRPCMRYAAAGSLPGGRCARRYALYQLLPRLRRAGQARFRPGGIYELPRRRRAGARQRGRAGGRASGLNLRGRERIVEKLLERGAEGLEVFNNYHDDRQIAYFAPLVRRRGALMTCGSDFHGKTKPLIHVGRFGCDVRWESSLADSVARLAKGV